MPVEDVTVEPMTEGFIVWRCLHGGPLTRESIEVLPEPARGPAAVSWEALRARNVPLMAKLVRTYGTCAILAKDGDMVVGTLRFYPKALHPSVPGAVQMCLQQAFPNGPAPSLVDEQFLPVERLGDKTLKVHCLMTGSVKQSENPYQRRGLAKRMVRELVRWGRERGWQAIEADAFEDMAVLYSLSGGCGRIYWERLGFTAVARATEPAESFGEDLLAVMREQAVAIGLSADDAQNRYTMRLALA